MRIVFIIAFNFICINSVIAKEWIHDSTKRTKIVNLVEKTANKQFQFTNNDNRRNSNPQRVLLRNRVASFTTKGHIFRKPISSIKVHQNKQSRRQRNISDTEYNYDYLLNEYYEESVEEAKSMESYHVKSKALPEVGFKNLVKKFIKLETDTDNCSDNGIGLQTLRCLLTECKSQEKSTLYCASRLWSIFKTWLLVYLAIAVPLWCTRGWCCCCLCCEFFRPKQTIAETRKYAILNPPGILRAATGDIEYTPTENEKDCYEELEHLIKII